MMRIHNTDKKVKQKIRSTVKNVTIPWVVQEAGGEGEGGGAPAPGQGEPGPWGQNQALQRWAEQVQSRSVLRMIARERSLNTGGY